MSSLEYVNYEPFGPKQAEKFHYSQAVIIGDIVKCAGQGGWDANGILDVTNTILQVDQAFDNVDRALQAVGLRGWEDVYSVRSYHIDMDASFPRTLEKLKEKTPNHRPIWTVIGVKALGDPKMLIEIEVEAYRGRK